MPQRALWNGFLKLSLVSCPIALHPAIAADKRVAFRQVNRNTGNRLRHQLVDAGTGEVVGSVDRGRGYEVGEDQFVMVEDEELRAAVEEARTRPFAAVRPAVGQAAPAARAAPGNVAHRDAPSPGEKLAGSRAGQRAVDLPRPPAPTARVESFRREEPAMEAAPPPAPRPINDRTISLDRFVAEDEIDRRYLDTPYYIVPRDEIGAEAFVVIRDAMRAKGMAGMGRVVIQRRERPIIVAPMGVGLAGFTLRYVHEVRSPAEYFATIPEIDLPEDMVEMAALLIDKKAESFDPAFLEDRYRTVLVEKLRAKTATLPAAAERAAPVSHQNVIDLMAALKRSIGTESRARTPGAAAKKPGRRRVTAAAAKQASPAKRSRSR